MLNEQASPIHKGMGRKLRRARNVVKKWCNPVTVEWREKNRQRYERACALILADKLRNS